MALLDQQWVFVQQKTFTKWFVGLQYVLGWALPLTKLLSAG